MIDPDLIYQWIQLQLTQNDVFAGVVGGSALVSILYALKNVPEQLWQGFLFRFTSTVTIYNDNEIFSSMKLLFSDTSYVKKNCQRFHISRLTNSRDEESSVLGFGPGRHLFFYKRKFVVLHYEISQPDVTDTSVSPNKNKLIPLKEHLTIRVLTRNKSFIEDMLADAEKLEHDADGVTIFEYSDSWWDKVDFRKTRKIDSLIIDENEKTSLINDVKEFFAAKNWYIDRSIPYKRGYLLSGIPGTGKSSMVLAIASEFDRPLYVLNLNSIQTDSNLMTAFQNLKSGSILLMEDIDATNVAVNDRKATSKKNKLSLSGLLNAIDGVTSPEDIIMFITTNHPDHIDEALLRPGRIDKTMEFKPLTPELAQKMFEKFYVDTKKVNVIDIVKGLREPLTPATMQMILLNNKYSPEKVVEDLKKLNE